MSLSDKAVKDVRCSNPIPNYYWEEDVREFIKELKEKWPDAKAIHITIDELAGPKLT